MDLKLHQELLDKSIIQFGDFFVPVDDAYKMVISKQIELLESMKQNDTGEASSIAEWVSNGHFDDMLNKKIIELKLKLLTY